MIIKRLVWFCHKITENLTQGRTTHGGQLVAHPCPPENNKKHLYSKIQHKDILTLEEAALYLEVDIDNLLIECRNGTIPGKNIAGKWRFLKAALTNHLAGYQQQYLKLDLDENATVEDLSAAYEKGIRDFSGSNLCRASLYQLDLPDIRLAHSNLREADLWQVNLNGGDLTGADLRNANLIKANLIRTNLTNSDLSYADLIGADLGKAVLCNACLKNIDLTGADLVDADLAGTDLTGAILDSVRWSSEDPQPY